LSEGNLPRLAGPLGVALPFLAAIGTAGLIWVVGSAIWQALAQKSG
jgi:hypothetical protein